MLSILEHYHQYCKYYTIEWLRTSESSDLDYSPPADAVFLVLLIRNVTRRLNVVDRALN